MALVVDVQRAAAVGEGAVVEHGHALGRHALADAAGEGAAALAVEVALQAVAHGFVQQHAGPAGAQHHGHLAGGHGAAFQVGERGVHRVLHVAFDDVVLEIAQAEAPAAAGRADLAAHHAAHRLLGDHGHVQPHQRPHVGGARAVGARHQHDVVFGAQAGHHLRDARVLGAGELFHLFQQRHLLRAVQRGDGVGGRVQHAAAGHAHRPRQLHAPVLARRGDGAHGACGVEQRVLAQVVGIGEGRLLAGHGAHAHALVDAEAAALDDAFLQAPALVARGLEVEVGVVDAVFADGRQRPRQRGLGDAERFQHQALRDGQAFEGGFAGDHGRASWGWTGGLGRGAKRARIVGVA